MRERSQELTAAAETEVWCLDPDLLPALRLLIRAADYAADAGGDAWQFAVELRDLNAAGLTRHDLRWLLAKGFAEHAQETTAPGDPARCFRPLPRTAAPPNTCVLLTAAGAQALRPRIAIGAPRSSRVESGADCAQVSGGEGARGEHVAKLREADRAREMRAVPAAYPDRTRPPAHPGPAPTQAAGEHPEWDPNHRELRFRGQVVKRYRVPAPNQELILSAFQEDGWPEFIDDPLPPAPNQDPKLRLQATIKSLNRHQMARLVRFHGNGGTQIYWEPV